MSTIQIEIDSENLEKMTVSLNDAEVTALYNLRKANQVTIDKLNKEVETLKTNNKYVSEGKAEKEEEINEANLLLSALNVPEKTNEEEAYYRKPLSLVTRIALYIALAAK